jgi:hypothetical protein
MFLVVQPIACAIALAVVAVQSPLKLVLWDRPRRIDPDEGRSKWVRQRVLPIKCVSKMNSVRATGRRNNVPPTIVVFKNSFTGMLFLLPAADQAFESYNLQRSQMVAVYIF